jgi:hypothetical protein
VRRFGGIGVGLVGAEEGKRAEKINVISEGASGGASARALEGFAWYTYNPEF